MDLLIGPTSNPFGKDIEWFHLGNRPHGLFIMKIPKIGPSKTIYEKRDTDESFNSWVYLDNVINGGRLATCIRRPTFILREIGI